MAEKDGETGADEAVECGPYTEMENLGSDEELGDEACPPEPEQLQPASFDNGNAHSASELASRARGNRVSVRLLGPYCKEEHLCPRWVRKVKLRRAFNLLLCLLLALAVVALVRLRGGIEDVQHDDDDSTDTCSTGSTFGIQEVAAMARASNGMVACDYELCSQMGSNILSKGGNAIDAAVTVALCGGVTRPFESGIGGGGIMVLHLSNGTEFVFDFRETAPAAAHKNMFNNSSESHHGGKSIATPGELKGLEHVWNLFGSLPWKELVEPVADLAGNGYEVDDRLAHVLSAKRDDILQSDLRVVFAPNGKLLQRGDNVKMPQLADTLRLIAQQGSAVLYQGSLTSSLVSDIQNAGGIITVEDLKEYSVVQREPLRSYYHGYEIVGAPAPFGGPVVAMIANLLERYQLGLSRFSPLSQHLTVEAMKWAFSDRAAMGDPEYLDEVNSFVQPTMTSKSHASELRRQINPDLTYSSASYSDIPSSGSPVEDHGTAHFVVVDSQRAAVSFTSTINLTFGSKVLSKSTGIILNDEMDDFSSPNFPNQFGLPPAEPNFIEPGKRPLSSMSPTIVLKDGDVFLVVGAAGGPRIITSTLQIILNVIDYKVSLVEAMSAARLHHQLYPPILYAESAIPNDVIDGLIDRNHTLELTDVKRQLNTLGNAQAVLVQDDGTLIGVTDWRRGGSPYGY